MTMGIGIVKNHHNTNHVLIISILVFAACSRSLSDNGPSEQFERETEPKFFEPFQLTAGSESNFSPDLSPDGQYIYYTSDRSGNKDIWRKKASGGFAKPLSIHSADDLAPVISPDGDQIAFISRRHDAAGDVHVMGVKGEKKASIKGIQHPLFEDSEPAWFPDGKRLLFASRRPGEQVPMLMTADLSTLKAEALGSVQGTQAKVFPDGRRIIFVKDGSLYIYDEAKHRSKRITDAGGPQDGQPFIAKDGKTLVFLRYTDDTNKDGLINADDRATIWSLDISRQSQAQTLENYALTPLSSAKISAYSPQIRDGRLYFTKQTGFGLDIYYLPTFGQIRQPRSLAEVKSWFHRLSDPHDKTYLLRRSAAAFYKRGQQQQAAELALWELDWQISQGHSLEAKWVYKKLIENFSQQQELTLLANLSMLELALTPMLKLKVQDLDELKQDQLKDLLSATDEIRTRAEENQFRHALAKCHYLIARIKAVLGQYFKASEMFAMVADEFADIKPIAALAMYEQGKLLPRLSGKESAIAKLTELIKNYPEQTTVVVKASELAVSYVEDSQKPEAAIHLLRSSYLDLPILPAYAHLRIAERFAQANKDIVAANEYRAMIDLYPQSPKILLTAARRLAAIVEREGRIDEAESIIYSLWQQFKGNKSEYLQEAEKLLIALLSRKGEGLIRKNFLSQALKTYQTIISLNPNDLSGYRGMIKVQFLQGELEDAIDSWEKKLSKDRSLTALYALAYAKTFQLEESESLGDKVAIIQASIDMLEQCRDLNDQIPQVHQTLGWLYQQNDFWQEQYERKGGLAGVLGEGWNTINLFKVVYLALDFRVLNPFREEPKNFLELSVDSYLAAYHLTEAHSVARAHLAQNLAHTYYSLGNFKKAIHFYSERIADIKVIPVEPIAAEALFWQRAGRSAFQVGETKLAAALQKKALVVWEQAGYPEPLAHTMDSLALSLAELNANLKAQEYYLKLIAEHRKNKRFKNLNKVYINLALSYKNQKDYPKALEMLGKADQTLKDHSLPPDFSLQQQLIANSLRINMYKVSGYHRLEHDALVQKVQLLEKKYELGRQRGESEAYLLLERSIAYNQLGNLYKDDGNWQKGIESFKKALAIAELKRKGQKEKLAASEELANLLSLGRMELMGLASGVYRAKQVDDLLARIEREIDLIYSQNQTADKQQELEIDDAPDLLAQLKNLPEQTFPLVSLKGFLLAYQSHFQRQKNNRADKPIQANLEQNLKRSFQLASVQKKMPLELPSLYLAWKNGNYETTASSQAIGALIPEINQSFSRNHYTFWKYMSEAQDWKEATAALESYIFAGGVLDTYTDRNLARKSYESFYLESGATSFAKYFQSYQSIKLREMLWRTYYWDGSGSKDKKKFFLQSFKERYDDLLRLKDLEDIKESLKPHEAVLAAHRFKKSNRIWFAWMDNDEIIERVFEGDSFQAALELIKGFPFQPKNIEQLYIVPSDELYRENWELLSKRSSYLSDKVGISFLPSFDVLPIISDREFNGRYYLGFSAPKSIKPSQKKQDYQDYLAFGLNHKQEPSSFVADMSSFQMIDGKGVLRLNSFEPKRSEWLLSSGQIDDGSLNISVRLRDLASASEHHTAALVFPKVEYIKDPDLPAQAHDAWISLWFALFTTGTNQLVLQQPHFDPAQNAKSVQPSIAAFYETAQSEPFSIAIRKSGLPLRSIGYEGLLDEEELEGLIDETMELFEEYQDEGELAAARTQLLRLIYFYKRAEMGDDFWEYMGQLAWLFYRLKEFDKALQVQKMLAESILSLEDDEVSYAESLMNAANFAHLAGDYDQSNTLLDKCEQIFAKEEDLISSANVWHLKAINAEKKGKFKKAIDAYLKSLELFEEEGEDIEVAKKYRAIGTIYQIRLNSYGKALAYFRKAAEILIDLEEEKVLALVYIETANTYIAMGQVGGAIELLERANLMIDEQKEPILKIRALQNLGIAFFRRNLLLDAQNTVKKNFIFIEQLDEEDPIKAKTKRQLYIDALNLEGMIAAKKGEKEKSFETFDHALKLARKYNFQGKVAFILNNYGFWSREFGQVESSIEYMEEALKIDIARKARTDEAFDLRNLGLSAIVLGQKDRARELLQSALKISQDVGISYNIIYCYIGLGDIAFLSGNWKLARNHYAQGLAEAKSKHIDDFVWKSETAIAKTYLQESNTIAAQKSLERALTIINELPPGLSSQSSSTKLSTEMGVQEVYEQMMKVLLNQKQHKEVWLISEQAKLRQIVDSLGFLNLPFSKKKSSNLVASIRELKNQILNHKVKLDADLRKNPEAFAQWQTEDKALRNSYQAQLSKLEQSDPDASAFLKVKTAKLSQIQQRLGGAEGLISYFVLADELLIFLLKKDRLSLKRVSMDRKVLKRKIADFKTIMEHYSAIHFMAANLYDLLLKPIDAELEDLKRLGVSPHRWLHQLAYSSLFDGSKFLLERFNLYFLEAWSNVPDIPKKQFKFSPLSSRILAFADPKTQGDEAPLLFARREVESLSRYFKNVDSFVGEEAKKIQLQKLKSSYDILHIATHSHFNETSPQISSLVFAGSERTSQLRTKDIFSLESVPYLVSLSACESGFSSLNQGEPTIGLERAFFYAGAHALLSSLWRIDDVASAVVMKRFYRYLAEGFALSEALQKSQLHVKKYFEHPAYWASFKLSGSFH